MNVMNVRQWKVLLMSGLLLLLFTATACSSQSLSNGSNTDGAAKPAEKKELELKVFGNANTKYAPGEDENNNMFIDLIKQETGIQLIVESVVTQDYVNTVNLAIAANNAPDVIEHETQYIGQWVRSGALQPLDDLIEQYGSPKLKEWLNYRNGEGVKPLTFDGKLYALPVYQHVDQNSMLLYLRKDWLEKLSLSVPTTTDELRTVLKAFVENDPDGNGTKDTLGMIMTNKIGASWAASIDPLLGAFGGTQGYWIEKNGALEYGSIQPEMKAGLQLLQEWYKEGLIDQEFAVDDEMKALEKVSANRTGAYFAPAWDVGWNIANSQTNDPNAQWILVDIPAGPDGIKSRRGDPLVAGGIGLYTNSQNGEAFIKYFNSFLDNENVYNAKRVGFEGYNYALDQDGIPFTPENPVDINYLYPDIKLPEEMLGYLTKPKEQWNFHDLKMSATISPLRTEGDRLAMETRSINVYDQYTGAPTPTMQSKSAVLIKMEHETFIRIIMGASLDEFDAFVANWKSAGGNEITKEVNDWYNSLK